jgi:hypothetical protein
MTGKHLKEDVLQRYALEPGACPPEVLVHLAECTQCRVEAEGYRQLGKLLRDQPVPGFSFDLAAAVMTRLDSATPTATLAGKQKWVSRLSVPAVIAILAVIPAWLFRKTAYFVFADMSAVIAWIILAAAGIAVLFWSYRYYRKYQHFLHLIN